MDFTPVPTRASRILQNDKVNEFKAIVFEEPKTNQTLKESQKFRNFESKKTMAGMHHGTKAEEESVFDIKKARHEVLRFAMNNQRSIKNKKKMEIFQAIKLGAKPPKKAYKNYKDLKDERKRLKDIREQRKKFHQLGKNQTGAASVKCRSKTKLEKQNKKRAPVTAIDQHYGKVRPKRS